MKLRPGKAYNIFKKTEALKFWPPRIRENVLPRLYAPQEENDGKGMEFSGERYRYWGILQAKIGLTLDTSYIEFLKKETTNSLFGANLWGKERIQRFLLNSKYAG